MSAIAPMGRHEENANRTSREVAGGRQRVGNEEADAKEQGPGRN